MKIDKFDELLDEFYDELLDETCSMSEEEYEKALKLEQEQVDDFLNNHYFSASLRLLKLGVEYNFNMKNVFMKILDDYDNTEDENLEILDVCNKMINLSNTLSNKYIACIENVHDMDNNYKNKCKELEFYINELDFYLMSEIFNLQDDYICIDNELLNEKLKDEIKYLNRKCK